MITNKIKFAQPEASNLGDALGLDLDRQNVLAAKLDEMVSNLSLNGPQRVYLSTIIGLIEEFCDTHEEFVWCFVNHTQWAAATGRFIPAK